MPSRRTPARPPTEAGGPTFKLADQPPPLFTALSGTALRACRQLLGMLLVDTSGPAPVVGRIVEAEAYQQDDAASHSFRGPTPRTHAMFGRAGLAYVYRSYGLHWCINVSCGQEGHGAAVLLRAAVPLAGLGAMRARRLPFAASDRQLARGPGNLARAFGIDIDHNGTDLLDPNGSLRLLQGALVPGGQVLRAPRVGISVAQETLWRLYCANNPYVSGPRNGVPLRSRPPGRHD